MVALLPARDAGASVATTAPAASTMSRTGQFQAGKFQTGKFQVGKFQMGLFQAGISRIGKIQTGLLMRIIMVLLLSAGVGLALKAMRQQEVPLDATTAPAQPPTSQPAIVQTTVAVPKN